jgi:4-amino-4-deoxy-L-arabinose transferase-like glycosyltransferase
VTPETRQRLQSTVVPLALIAAVFLSLCLPSITVPRLNAEEIDECLFVRQNLLRPTDGLSTHGPATLEGVSVAGRYLPLMEDNHYVGAVELYLQLPFLWVLGNNPFALRLMPIVVSLLGMMAAFLALRSWFGMAAALGATLLTCTHPVFVHFTRQGHYKEEIFTVALFWLGLQCFQRLRRSERHRLLYAVGGGLMFGLGLAHKITFLWYLGACAVACLVVLRGRLDRAGVTPRQAIAAASAFVVGALPLLVHNAVHGFVTLRLMADRLLTPTPKDDIDNLEYLVNVVVRGKQMLAVIVGGEIWDTEWFGILEGIEVAHNAPLIVAFCAAVVVVPLLSFVGIGRLPRRPVAFVWIVFGLVFLCSPFTVSYHHPSHLLVLYPFPGIAVALMLVAVARLVGRGWIGPAVAGAAAAAILVVSVNQTLAYHRHARAYYPDPQDPWSDDFSRNRSERHHHQTLIPQDRWKGGGNDKTD